MSRATLAILSTENLYHNLNVFKSLAPHSQIMVMVKANAYGHGIRSVAQRLDGKIDKIGVASIDEALAIRAAGVTTPITLIEGVFDADELVLCSTKGFEVVFHDESQIQMLRRSYHCLKPITAWLKINTGMGRLGFNLSHAAKFYALLQNSPIIANPVGILSHFACAETPEHPLNSQQIEAFKTFTQPFPLAPLSFCNSAATVCFPEQHYQLIRPGLAIYGIQPTATKKLDLRPVMTLQTRLIATSYREPGSFIGYGASFQCPPGGKLLVGVIALGYGDGYPRTAPAGTPVLVNQKLCRIVGRVSMDMITIDLTNSPEAAVGDPVVIWGDQLPIETVADVIGRSVYEMITNVALRVKFHWD
jgi:alanine racemase